MVVYSDGRDVRVIQPDRLLYQLTPTPAMSGSSSPSFSMGPSAGLAEAERAELREKDYQRAAQLYEALLAGAESSQRPLLLHRLARTSRKAGLRDDALRYYRELELAGADLIGALPSDLVANFELCSIWADEAATDKLTASALALYRGLVEGRWRLERPRYLFYADAAWRWLQTGPQLPNEALRLREAEQQKLPLSEAVEGFLQSPRRLISSDGGVSLAFWRSDPLVALLLPDEFVKARIWERLSAPTTAAGLRVALVGSDRRVVFGDSLPSRARLDVRRDLAEIGMPLRLHVWPVDTALLYADLNRRQNLYLSMLAFVIAFLGFGSYLTVRTVRRELQIATLKSEFVSAVSHEFRSPLTGIRQLAEMLLRGRIKSETRRQDYYEMIVRESGRLTRLVENVLDFSRIEEGRKHYDFQRLDPTEWLPSLVEEFRLEVADRQVSVVAEIPEALPTLRGDREALTCAVHNLLDNAVKYAGESNRVWLSAAAVDETLSIRVRDEGVGISEEDQQHVFEKFFRGGGETPQEVKGVGLGLSLVQQIVKAHGGSIALESRLGHGSTFSIQLPAAPTVRQA